MYEVTVRASDRRVYGHYDVLVTVEPVDEPPEFQSGSKDSFTCRENGTYALYTYRATDPEGADVGWSVSGTGAGHFAISNTGVLSFSEPPNSENPERFDGDGYDNDYEVTVVVADHTGRAANLPITVVVTDVDEGPEITGCTDTILDTVFLVEFEDCDELTVSENHEKPCTPTLPATRRFPTWKSPARALPAETAGTSSSPRTASSVSATRLIPIVPPMPTGTASMSLPSAPPMGATAASSTSP